jgi:S-DNA-T family DNA segregation ATPase FtsK/SpoIIIE
MAKVYTSRSDEETVTVILRKGFLAQGHKWTVLRVALALSLKQPSPPSEDFDDLAGRKDGEYTLEVLTGRSQKESDAFVDAFRALLSVYHQQDLFGDGNEALFARLLQRHIRRGLREIQTSWRGIARLSRIPLPGIFSLPKARTRQYLNWMQPAWLRRSKNSG